MLHKYKPNVTFNVINTQIIYVKEKPMKKQGVDHFSIGGSIFYYSILNPGSFLYTGQYSIWHWLSWRATESAGLEMAL